MYEVLTAITPGCVAFSLPVQRRNRLFLDDSSVFPTLPQPARARGGRRSGFEPERRPIPGTPSQRDGFEQRHGHNRTRRGPLLISAGAPAPRRRLQRPIGGPTPPSHFPE